MKKKIDELIKTQKKAGIPDDLIRSAVRECVAGEYAELLFEAHIELKKYLKNKLLD